MSERKSRTLFVRNLPFTASNEKLLEVFEQVGPIKTAFVVADKDTGKCKGYAFVQFSMLEDAIKAKQTVTHCGGRKIFLDFADAKKKRKDKGKMASQDGSLPASQGKTPEGESAVEVEEPKDRRAKPAPKAPKQNPVKRCRLVVRNLNFKCKEADLKAHFEKFGDVSEVTIPLKNGCSSRGFGFVQFTQLQAAQKAVAAMNAQEIMGRPVAVDWAVAKDRFVASTQHDSDKDSGVSEEEGKEGDSETEEEAGKTDEEEDKSDTDHSSEEEDSDNDSSDGDDSGDTDSDEGSDDSALKPEKKPVVQRKSDVDEGRTLFVRNIPFEAEEEEVAEAFEEFGDLVYTRLVIDKLSGRPRGAAFVQFTSQESAEQCLAKAQSGERGGGLVIQGRALLVAPAVSRTEAESQKAGKKVKEQKDTRNLFLAREGLIRAGTQAASGISQEDMKKRMKVEQMKREKLKNINIFVSSTRLCIHNLPTHVNENELKKVLRQTVSDSTMRITECRVMRNLDRTNKKGVSKSLGYAFVNFSTHEHALKALRGLNNSTVFGDHKRPIVEFSLENKKALEAKEKRLEKSKVQAAKKKAEGEEAKGDKALTSPVKRKGKQTKFRANKEQDLVAKSLHTGPKGMPKRMGPKIRHRNRGKGDTQVQAGKAKKGKKWRQNQPKKQQPKPKAQKRKREEVTDNVDRLVSKYQAKKARRVQSS